MDWPERGVYFFFANDEYREGGDQLRLTRIGTHAVSSGSGTSMWNRLLTAETHYPSHFENWPRTVGTDSSSTGRACGLSM